MEAQKPVFTLNDDLVLRLKSIQYMLIAGELEAETSSIMHDLWRKNRNFEPRWKDLKDEKWYGKAEAAIREGKSNYKRVEGRKSPYQMDIAGTDFRELPPHLQEKSILAARKALPLVHYAYNWCLDNGTALSKEQGIQDTLASHLHRLWIRANRENVVKYLTGGDNENKLRAVIEALPYETYKAVQDAKSLDDVRSILEGVDAADVAGLLKLDVETVRKTVLGIPELIGKVKSDEKPVSYLKHETGYNMNADLGVVRAAVQAYDKFYGENMLMIPE
ncbi:MAG: hypothetical protein V1744_01715 [Candidatus Altiarchaeota archaeon]